MRGLTANSTGSIARFDEGGAMARRNRLEELPDRVPLTAVLSKIGKSRRQAERLAARGKIPSAARIGGGAWTVVPAAIVAWIDEAEMRQRSLRSRASIRPVSGSSLKNDTGKLYEREILRRKSWHRDHYSGLRSRGPESR